MTIVFDYKQSLETNLMCNHLWSSLSVVNDNGLVSIGTGHEAAKDRRTRVFKAASAGNLDIASLTQASHP